MSVLKTKTSEIQPKRSSLQERLFRIASFSRAAFSKRDMTPNLQASFYKLNFLRIIIHPPRGRIRISGDR